jgi:glycosyltransferase involved in cell wall biosynthesis
VLVPAPDLSIVIPAFNEERRLPKSLERIHSYVVNRRLNAEVIVVDDGSADNTAGVVEALRKGYSELRLVCNGRNRGKGFSVRHGMQAAVGQIALFTDADLSAPIEEADKLLAVIRESGADGAIGSRALNRNLIEVHQAPLREWAGMLFNRAVRIMTGVPYVDTQCGFKAFRCDATRIVFAQQRIAGFGFDPEILFLARRHRLRVVEVPVRWSHDPATKVHVARDSIRMLVDLVTIRWNELCGRYPRGS